ncbi:MAG: YebC/PmpR family DNA-binding transcriptional regulator [Pseudodesulfovibrio sp.]|jgi:YebC/PmpR family DNA-binding regulatory protein|uniref:Probable transcriptional regulatory protein AWY79_08915 n=1 Tax=Pseudodesulfovibrio indicus TaxID=1716143 RepID=A0A126QN72_9BACT|nr:YebC/PmpR family DNA-binding transcriptional regulator [Pseudodesulfovibrio indicus]AMK11226.1 transcriptional regulator [Pseudodesulfovibrio indicus]TDT92253.1 YebC/PmpR family DNA-binding regulatory protein [Pseudodesulfovibrio indicus]
MAGHSKWANIQHRKGRQDAKKAKFFTKAAKDIILAAKAGGGNPDDNSTLRLAIQKAKAVNLPKDRIENAIKKGTGELAGGDLAEIMYEGYGPGGVAMLVEVATDNKNRTVAEIRHAFSKHGGNMAENGAVSYLFNRKGVIVFNKEKFTEDQLMEIGLEAGAEDIIDDGDSFTVHTAPGDFMVVQQAFADAGMEYESAEFNMVPETYVPVDASVGKKVMNLFDALDDNDDTQNVYMNADLPDDLFDEE